MISHMVAAYNSYTPMLYNVNFSHGGARCKTVRLHWLSVAANGAYGAWEGLSADNRKAELPDFFFFLNECTCKYKVSAMYAT